MEKLRLELQDLEVQSFATHDPNGSRKGTVNAHLMRYDITDGGNTCEGGVTCAGGGGCYYESYPNDTCYQSCDQLFGCGGGGDPGGGTTSDNSGYYCGSDPWWGQSVIASHC